MTLSAGACAPLDLCARATEITGLDTVPRSAELDALQVLISSIEQEGNLSAAELDAHRASLVQLLVNRQQLLDFRARNPGVAAERVERPLIVCGMPRSGTTLLHCLLAQDPNNRAALVWERHHPCPPPAVSENVEARIELADSTIRQVIQLIPGLLRGHPYWDALGRATVECDDILQLAFATIYFAAFNRAPRYRQWLTTADFTPFYEFHRSYLQHLQWQAPSRRWVLKGLSHAYYLHEIKAVYPDAVLVWPHRDIVTQMASTLEFGAVIRNRDDPEALAQVATDWLEYTEQGLRRGLRSPLFDDDEFVCHIAFRDLLERPADTVISVYERYDIPVPDDLGERIERWLAEPANRADRHGRFSYSLDRFGMRAEEITERFEFYTDRLANKLDGR